MEASKLVFIFFYFFHSLNLSHKVILTPHENMTV